MATFSPGNLVFLYRGIAAARGENPYRVGLQAFGSVTFGTSDPQSLDGTSATFGGAVGDYLSLLDSTGNIASADFYLYARASFWGNSSGAPMAIFGRAPGSGNQSYYLYANGNRSGVVFWSSTDGNAGTAAFLGASIDLTNGLPHTFEVSRQSGLLRIFVDGVLVNSQSRPSFYSNPTAKNFIGQIGVTGYQYPAKMTLDEVALVVGEAVETDTHPARTTPIPAPPDAPSFAPRSQLVIRGSERPAAASRFDPGRHHLDLEDGGQHRIVGTVKVKGTPNVPVHRRVVLINERSRRIVRETWSDPVTGYYAFEGIRGDVAYTTLAYDYTGNYRGVLADNLTAERMP